MKIPSKICLSLMNPDYDSPINLPITLSSLLFSTLEMILNDVFIRLIGLKSENEENSFFGMSVMKEELNPVGK